MLSEGLNFKDLVGMMKPTIHIDEFSSKMGDDDEILVASFFVRDRQAAKDIVNWLEKGYDAVIDADTSPGEIRPNRYLVYTEMKRRSNVADKLEEILSDFSTLTEYEDSSKWTLVYRGKDQPWSVEAFNATVPTSPKEYRERKQADLNEMRIAAGITPRRIYQPDQDLKRLQSAAGI